MPEMGRDERPDSICAPVDFVSRISPPHETGLFCVIRRVLWRREFVMRLLIDVATNSTFFTLNQGSEN